MSSTRLPRKKSKQRPTGFFRQVKNSKKKKIKVFAVLTHIYTHTLIRQGSVKHSFTTRFSFSSLLLNPLSLLVRMSREREREAKRPEREKDKGAQLYRVRGRVQNRSSSDTVQQVKKKKKLQLPKREIQQTINQRQVRGSCGLRRFSLIRFFLQNNKNEVNEP